jgi:DNA modification methylase
MPQDFAEYLRAMISPEERTLTTTEGGECVYLHVVEPDDFPWAEHGDASVHGLTVEAGSLAGQATWLPEAYRVLKPGAHLMLVAPDEEPTGHTGACVAEDTGFEVRDTILWVHGEGSGGKLHYTAKAARSEREAGLYAEWGEDEGGKRKNVHPTVKSVEVMTKLLHNVPKDRGPVLDPFLGSGTTLLACIETGHDGVGIEREREYLEIADARVRHRDYETAGWNRATIHSDVAPAPTEKQETAAVETSLDDFFGL